MSLGCHATYSHSQGIASVDADVIPASAGMTSRAFTGPRNNAYPQ